MAEFLAQIFEAVMLVCFGWAWPVALAKTLRVRKVHGQSVVFLCFVLVGYLSGIVAKILIAAHAGTWPSWVTILYALNAVMVGCAIVLYFRFHEADDKPGVTIEPEPPAAEVIED
jgi:hypothetical protein